MTHLEVACGEPDDGGLVQLAGDGRREWQHLGKIQELGVLLLSATASRVLALLFHTCQQTTVVRTTFTTHLHNTRKYGEGGQQQQDEKRSIQDEPCPVTAGLINPLLQFAPRKR